MNPEKVHIVYASDDKFAGILGVSLYSLLSENQDLEEISVYILDGGISAGNRKKIEVVCRSFDRHLPVWIDSKDIAKKLPAGVFTDRGSLSQYARLFVSSFLPEDLDRILYLDCDTLVLKSIQELWNLDLQGKTIGALADAFSPWYRRNIGLEKNDVLFNSGVMLIDLPLWRQRGIEEKLLSFIAEKKGKVQQGDQGALNAVLSKECCCFAPQFNAVTIFFDFSYDEMLSYRKPPAGFYCREEILEATENPAIVHFTSSFISKRPWVNGSAHRYAKDWLTVKASGPWKDEPLQEDAFSWWKRAALRLPRRILIRLAGIAQAYLRPMYFHLKS